jgi:hypothetical protein
VSRCNDIVQKALHEMRTVAGGEAERLKKLKVVNPSISDLEIQRAEDEVVRLETAIKNTAPQLDALRLIWCPERE